MYTGKLVGSRVLCNICSRMTSSLSLLIPSSTCCQGSLGIFTLFIFVWQTTFVIVFPTLEGNISSIAILTRMLSSQSWESTPVVINSSLSSLMCHPSLQSSILKIPSQSCSLGSSWDILARFCDSFSKQSLFSHSMPGCDVILLRIPETGRAGGNSSRGELVSPWKSPAQGGSLHGLQTREGCHFWQGGGCHFSQLRLFRGTWSSRSSRASSKCPHRRSQGFNHCLSESWFYCRRLWIEPPGWYYPFLNM